MALREGFGPVVWKQVFRNEINSVQEVEKVCGSKNVSKRLVNDIGTELNNLQNEKRKRQNDIGSLTS